MLLEPEEAQLIAIIIACLHNFLRRSSDLPTIYTPRGTFDYEEKGRVIEGSWRAMSNENMSFLFLSFHRVLNLICSFLGNSPASEF